MRDIDELTIHDIVKEMDVHEKTVRRWIENKELPAEKNISGHFRIKRSDLNEFIQRRKQKYNKSDSEE